MHISLLVLLIVPYLLVIILFIIGWFRIPLPNKDISGELPFVSVLVPVKNEEENLPRLISDLIQQDYQRDKYEIIFINDHSADATELIIKKIQINENRIRLVSLTEKSGKKAAIWEGIQISKGDLVLTTDGDCMVSQSWISTMVKYYQQFPEHLLIGPVFFEQGTGILNQFQNLEFLSLIASGAGAAGINRPILCNGANLGASKDLFDKGREVYKSNVASGDDIFLLLALKRQNISAVFVKDKHAEVVTKYSASLGQFLNQRTRWTFKSRFYKDFDIILVAIVVLFTNALTLGGLLFSFVNPKIFPTFLLFYLLKCFVDYILLYYVARFFDRRHLLKFFLVHQLLYVVYVSVVGFAGHFISGKWKERQG